jgi:hypothetical protein
MLLLIPFYCGLLPNVSKHKDNALCWDWRSWNSCENGFRILFKGHRPNSTTLLSWSRNFLCLRNPIFRYRVPRAPLIHFSPVHTFTHCFSNVKLKLQLSLRLNKYLAIKIYWGSGNVIPGILNLGTRGSEWSASRPSCFIPGVRAPGTLWIGEFFGSQDNITWNNTRSHVRSTNFIWNFFSYREYLTPSHTKRNDFWLYGQWHVSCD